MLTNPLTSPENKRMREASVEYQLAHMLIEVLKMQDATKRKLHEVLALIQKT